MRQPMPRKPQSPWRPKPPRAENQTIWENLVPLEQVPRVHLVCDVDEVVAPAVDHDHAAARLKRLEIVHDLESEEIGGVQRGLTHHDGDADFKFFRADLGTRAVRWNTRRCQVRQNGLPPKEFRSQPIAT